MTANPHDPVQSGNVNELSQSDPDRIGKIVASLETSHEGLRAVLDTVKGEQWEKQVQSEDRQWTVRQFLIHLVDAQRGQHNQLKAWQAGENPMPEDFDIDRWNRRQVEKNNDKTPDALLSELESGHEALMAFVRSLTPGDLEKTGRHSSLQTMTIEQLAHQIASHESMHTAEIAEKLTAG